MAASPIDRVLALVRCCHPEPTAAVTSLTTALAVSAGRGWGSVYVAAAVLSGQLSVGWANDYIDRDRDRAAGRMEKPIVAGRIGATTVRNGAIVALALAVPLSLLSGPAAAAVHLAAIGLAHAYNLWLKSTVLSVVPYALAFAMLPIFVTLGLGANAHVPAPWIIAAAGLIGAAAHFTQVLSDLGTDAGVGVRGLPQRLGYSGSVAAAAILLVVGALTAAFGAGRVPEWPALGALALTMGAVAALVAAGVMGRATTTFHLTIAAAVGALATFLLSGRGLL
ncbi:MAG TPA: UbiA family prenyltransferase [Candidatus Dormibacteraeota bacterium]|nr:UbiA family prenyltransferase [Candidatus Dormibacteraeota bacterium]